MSVRLFCAAAAAALFTAPSLAAPLAAGDLYVYRVGAGGAGLTNAATAVFLDEYTTGGSLVQSIAMPAASSGSNGRLTASGTATSEGLLTTSTDGRYIVLTGYDANPGTASIVGTTSTAVNRTVGRVDRNGNVDTTTKLSDAFSTNNIRSVATTNGTDLWLSGATAAPRYTTIGSSTSTQISTTVQNLRSIEIFDGQLYASTGSGGAVRVGAIGSGLPTTSGQTIVNLPGFATAGSPYAFFLADLSATVAGVDTLYVADDSIGISKYSLVSGNWVGNGTVGAASDTFRGLTGSVTGTTVNLYAVGAGGSGAAGGGKLVSLVDAAGYNGSFSGAFTTLATVAANTSFRGVTLLPVPEPATCALMAAGLGAMGLVARRRRRT